MDTEFSAAIASYFQSLSSNPAGVMNLKDLVKFSFAYPAEACAVREPVRSSPISHALPDSLHSYFGSKLSRVTLIPHHHATWRRWSSMPTWAEEELYLVLCRR